jgi:NAD(P)-dependent dehydrogenase (short-subunit alcohol dehydrogenase family)
MTSAWVTGASGAWGGAMARALLDGGHDLVALGRHDVPELAERAASLGRSWTFHPFDLSDPEARPPEGLPGVFVHAAVSTEGDRDELARSDYLGPAALIDAVARRMLRRGCGRIGVFVPQNARLGLAGLGEFSAPQAALWTWCEARRAELAADPRDVTLTLVIPGRTPSPTQRYVSELSGHGARLSPPDATPLVRAIMAGKRRAGRRPYLAAAAMLVR